MEVLSLLIPENLKVDLVHVKASKCKSQQQLVLKHPQHRARFSARPDTRTKNDIIAGKLLIFLSQNQTKQQAFCLYSSPHNV